MFHYTFVPNRVPQKWWEMRNVYETQKTQHIWTQKTQSNPLHYYQWIPDDKNGGGGFVFRGSKNHSNFSGLPGLQQQT